MNRAIMVWRTRRSRKVGGGVANNAFKEGGLEKIKSMVASGELDPNAILEDGLSLLHNAGKANDIEFIRMLAEKGANLNVVNNKGNTPLLAASIGGRFEVVKLLAELGADINIRNNTGASALYNCIKGKHDDIFMFLMMHDDINIDENIDILHEVGYLSLYKMFDCDIITKIIKSSLKINKPYDTKKQISSLSIAILCENEELINLIRGTEMIDIKNDDYDIPTLIVATFKGRLDLIMAIIEAGANINKTSSYIRHLQSSNNQPLYGNSERDSTFFHPASALDVAIYLNHNDIANFLIYNHATFLYKMRHSYDRMPTIYYALSNDNMVFIARILEYHKANNIIIDITKFLIDFTMSKKYNDSFDFILKNYKEFVDINKLLLAAVKQSNIHFVQMLKESGADVGSVTKYAYMIGNPKILKIINHENNNFKSLNEVNKKIYNYPKLNAPHDVVDVKFFKIQIVDDMPIMFIPKGTMLFNYYNNSAEKEMRILKTYDGVLPMGSTIEVIENNKMQIKMCLDKFSTKFFYSSPVGGLIYPETNRCNTFITKRDMRFALLMTPSPYHRLIGEHPEKYSCNKTNVSYCECTKRGDKCSYAKDYDVCLHPDFLAKHNLDGHIAVAGEDTFEKAMLENSFAKIIQSKAEQNIKRLTSILFNGGRVFEEREGMQLSGLPELVIQIFGTDWYGEGHSKKHTHIIDLPADHTPEIRKELLTDFLGKVNNDKLEDFPFHSPLLLLSNTSQTEHTDIINETVFTKETISKDEMPLNIYNTLISAYFAKQKQTDYFFDVRTGFLMNPETPLFVKMPDNSLKPYMELCLTGSEGEHNRDKSTLERTGIARRKVFSSIDAGLLPFEKEDCLIPALPMVGGKGNRTRRRLRRRPRTRTRI